MESVNTGGGAQPDTEHSTDTAAHPGTDNTSSWILAGGPGNIKNE